MSLFTPLINGDAKPDKRSGHVSAYYKGLFIVLAGYGDKDGKYDDFMPTKHVWCYNIENAQWTQKTTQGDHPGMSTGACLAVVGSKLYLFGGYYQNVGQTNQLYMLDLNNFTWTDLSAKTRENKPSPRDKFGGWIDNDRIIYFGGFGYPPEDVANVQGDFTYEKFDHGPGWNNHLYMLNTSELKWTQPKVSGDIPCPRAAFAATQIGCKGYLFGGRYQDERRSDLYMIDLHSFKWTNIKYETDFSSPIGRSWHTINPVSSNHLFVYGGFDNVGKTLQDCWLFNIREKNWEELKNCSSSLGSFAPRHWHTVCNTNSVSELVVFGGCSNSIIGEEKTVHSNTVAMFRFSP